MLLAFSILLFRYFNIRNDRLIFDLYFNNKSYKVSKCNFHYFLGIKNENPYENFKFQNFKYYDKNLTLISRSNTSTYHDYIISNDYNQILKDSDSLFYYEYQTLSKTINYRLFSELYGNELTSLDLYFTLIGNGLESDIKTFYPINEVLNNNNFKIDSNTRFKIKKAIEDADKSNIYIWFLNYGFYEFKLTFDKNKIVKIDDKYLFDIGLESN